MTLTPITKKTFIALHKNNKLRLVASCWRSLDYVQNIADNWTEIETKRAHLNASPTSRVDVNNQGKEIITKAYQTTLHKLPFTLLHTKYDNSKSNTCSMTDTQHNVILYAND